MALISCGIRRKLFFAVFVLLFPYVVIAGVDIGITPLPEDSSYIKDHQRTKKVLKALLYENNQLYDRAYLLWESFPVKSALVFEHLYQSGLSLTTLQSDSNAPKSEASFLLMLRFYTWQKRWDQASLLLNDMPATAISRMDTRLELIRSFLYLGWYERAESMMGELTDLSGRDQLHHSILKLWLGFLRGDDSEVDKQMSQLEEDYLYLPLSLLVPADFREYQQNIEPYKRSLVRFPSNRVGFERLILMYHELGDWDLLRSLAESQKHLSKAALSSDLLAEIYLNTDQFKKLKAVTQGQQLKKATPEFYDVIARRAIKEENWELLQLVATTYQTRYPLLLDGVLYQVIYLNKTGRREEAEHLLKKADVSLSLN